MIVEELLETVKDDLRGKRATDVRIGLRYTGVLLEDQRLGVSRSFGEEAIECCEVVDKAGELEGDALDLAKLAVSSRAVDSSLGIASINAALNSGIEGEEGPLLDFLEIRDGDKVGMVGNFKPVVEKIDKDIELFVFERNSQDEEIYPDWAVEQILPQVDVSIITGTSVVNKTIDHLIELSSNAREIAILGPTTPLAPEVFRMRGVSLLGGMVVEDSEKAMKIISQGGGTRKLGKVSRKVSIDLSDNNYFY
ncbi:hypothetical protein AKJ62_01075 [candidate division MSBL1 archaeon SCGC-AAA259D14]|uniref:DUF364 domain-containing protein n=3 Tax=candidate division MSBL1 TaxID=215777 RepID=A0A133U819_9EURY|nr:hypothetical protein AKJ61_01475 [candidate division MSBL1 archaeon SCGC-AAA259B11]KXA90345.1 hypothetical protein AKJ62_01075 [candidate division MSBL1 archaeon SCGC-AAA259D14]KXA95163.1 hypothetical protein AKJ36_01410 [candidate division MSBL1 archaeon SCGC-AAA259I07]